MVLFALLLVAAVVLLILFGHPASLWRRVRRGSPGWLILSVALEGCSIVGYIAAFRLLVADAPGTGWRFSAAVTLAGIVATKLIATLGAGGIALNVWALRATGMPGREIATRLAAFLVALYTVFMMILLVVAFGLYLGLLPGPAPPELTLIPGLIALGAIGAGAATLRAPRRVSRFVGRLAAVRAPVGSLAGLAAGAVDSVDAGARRAFAVSRERPAAIVGALSYWGLDMLAMWAALHAFGSPPAFAGVLVSYFVAQLLGALPVPGGIGVVEGGLAGSLIAFGAPGSLALIGVIAYRFISEWLPAVPAVFSYVSLVRTVERRRAEQPEGAR
jgi:uncharacterized membrane protein YbhN (UPF0104 family)